MLPSDRAATVPSASGDPASAAAGRELSDAQPTSTARDALRTEAPSLAACGRAAPAAIDRLAASDTLFRALLWGYPALLFGYWLLAEHHGIFGDEGWHLMFLLDAWQKPAASTWAWLWNLYVFNDQYPPVFYLLSAPFYFLFDGRLVGARVYSATLAAVVIAIFYRILRLYVGRWIALTGVVLLCSSGVFVEASRYYMLEICLLLWLLATYYLVATYLREASAARVAGLGIVLALGLLTKPNFVIYALPVGLLLLQGVIVRIRDGRLAKAIVPKHFALLLLPSLLLAMPWYVVNFMNPANMLAALHNARPHGELVPVTDPAEMLRFTWTSLPEFFPSFFYAAFAACALVVIADRWRRAGAGTIDEAERQRDLATVFFGGYVLYLTAILFPLGLYYALRWNLSYAFLAAAMACLLADLRSRWLRFAVALTLAALSALYTANNFVRQFTASPLLTWSRVFYWNPRAESTGVEEIAAMVAREERRAPVAGDGVGVSILTFVAGGVHAGAANYYLRAMGSGLKSQSLAFFDNAVDVDALLGSRYIVVPEILTSAQNNPESHRNQAVAQRWLPRHPEAFALLGYVNSRYGPFDVYKRIVPVVPATAEADLVDIGTELERGTAFEPFWRLARFRLAASTGRLTPELARVPDEVSAELPSLEGRLNAPIFERLRYETGEARELQRATASAKPRPLTESVATGGADGFLDASTRRVSQCLLLKGWVARADHTGPVKSVLVVRGDTVLAEDTELHDRPDVARYFGNDALMRTGFTACVPLALLGSDREEIRLIARIPDGTLHEFARRAAPR